jgi:sugar/nucleoside kinase (ribokinase family)
LLRDVLPGLRHGKKPVGFFDLSDCSKRTDERIQEAIGLIRDFSSYWDVVLSLNLNEASIIHSVLTHKKWNEDHIEQMCEDIFNELKIDTVVIHYSKQSVARNREGLHKRNSFFIKTPAILCGSGDNFNAGFCMGRLLGFDTGTSLVLGHATSHLYMESAQSPTTSKITDFLSESLVDSALLSKKVL